MKRGTCWEQDVTKSRALQFTKIPKKNTKRTHTKNRVDTIYDNKKSIFCGYTYENAKREEFL